MNLYGTKYRPISRQTFKFGNSPKVNACSQFFKTIRTSIDTTTLQETEDRMEIGLPVLEKIILNGRPGANIDQFHVRHSSLEIHKK